MYRMKNIILRQVNKIAYSARRKYDLYVLMYKQYSIVVLRLTLW